ncbi:hypothetical protein TanjilG_10512 [Lupinus angustifolius]|uniref:DUF4005 domain-containing protein n=1 Tax=Lupinus angustifolius TaxID=3871 RepID=A0A1J7FWA8_LUPAN|nr:hypothetical protein TanjilG_10512 [Lupinus angustifolius]
MAAIKIQTEFRAHLARKALRALKGVVRLQAIVRGQAARRELSSTSKKLLSNARKQVEVQERCNYSDEERCKHDKFKQFANRKKSSEEKEMKEITIPEMVEVSGRESSHILNVGQFVHKERASLSSKGWYNTTKVAHRNLKKQDLQEGLSSQISTQRKSFSHGKKKCVVDDNFMANSQVFPSYMAVTESTKAKIRSLSSPRQRKRYFDECSNHSVPQNKGIPF